MGLSPRLTVSQWELIQENTPLVYFVGQRYRHIPHTAYEDLISRLFYRLCVSVAQWDPNRGFKISSYIVKCLEGEVRNYFRDEIWTVRPPRRLREHTLSDLLEGDDKSLSIAEQHGENPEKIRTCALPISLDEKIDGEDGEFTPEFLSFEPDIENQVVNRIGGNQIVDLVYQSLRPEERTILALQSKGRPMSEIQERFRISRQVAAEVWEEVRNKAKDLYLKAVEGLPLPVSSGCEALSRAMKSRFVPSPIGFLDVRRRLVEEVTD